MGTAAYQEQVAEINIGIYEETAAKWRLVLEREMELESARPLAKSEAVRRIMEQENPDTGKPHSATSAEKVVEADPEYADFLRTLRDVVIQKHAAAAAMEAARLRAKLAVALAGGVQ